MKSTSRRNFLRGAGGAMLALPWLESLSAAAVAPKTRFALFYVPIGVVRRDFFPGESEAAIPKFTSSQIEIKTDAEIPVGLNPLRLTKSLEPLSPIQDKVSLITGMDRTYQHGSDVHAQCASCFMSSATAYSIEDSVYPLDRTLDHVIADEVGGETPFRTLEFSCNPHKDNKESIYFDNVSWFGTNHVAPSIRDPRKAYRRLFGTKEIQTYRNITDLVLADARSMEKDLGYADRQKFGEYFDSIRTIEEQMEKLEAMRGELAKVDFEEPPESRLPRGEYIRLMGDLMVVALETGLTRVATLMVGPERWDTPYMFDGVFDKPMSHHQMSHNQKKFIDQLAEVDRFHIEQFAYLVEKMAGIRESDGSSLLDNTLFTYGSGLGDGATHQYTQLPIIVAGKQANGQHLHCAEGTPLSNLWLSQAREMGLKLDRFSDSTGTISQLRS